MDRWLSKENLSPKRVRVRIKQGDKAQVDRNKSKWTVLKSSNQTAVGIERSWNQIL